jgi:hypothetical protein
LYEREYKKYIADIEVAAITHMKKSQSNISSKEKELRDYVINKVVV